MIYIFYFTFWISLLIYAYYIFFRDTIKRVGMVGLDRSVKFAEIDNVEIVDDSDLRQILIKFDNSLNEGFGEKSPLDKAGSENDKNKKKS